MEEKAMNRSLADRDRIRQATDAEGHVTEKKTTGSTSDLSPEEKEFCEKETRRLADLLSPGQPAFFATTGATLIDLSGAEKSGGITVARLAMNRKPKDRSVNAMAGAIRDAGIQIMLLVIPATVARYFRYEMEDFDGKSVPEDRLDRTVVIIDGQTRYLAVRRLREKYPEATVSNVYAYFPLHWVGLTKMLQTINLKVFTWRNSDFISGLRGLGHIKSGDENALAYIQSLEQAGYNYTAACEWVTLQKGIIRKAPLVKAMNQPDTGMEYENAGYGMEIHRKARKVFSGKNEEALKKKTVPELVIREWNAICRDLSRKEATAYIKAFLDGLTGDEISELTVPAGYKRGGGRKKEAFVKEQFGKSFQAFRDAHPYVEFREPLKTEDQ